MGFNSAFKGLMEEHRCGCLYLTHYSDWDTGWTTGKSGCIPAKTEIFVLPSPLKPAVGVLSALYPVNTVLSFFMEAKRRCAKQATYAV